MIENPGIVLVTGANGFLGSEVVRHLTKAGVPVRATGRRMAPVFPNVEYVRADILDLEEMRRISADTSTVIHAAGLAHIFYPGIGSCEAFFRHNEVGTRNVASAAAINGISHFILASSVSVYGSYMSSICSERNECNPTGAYAQSKLAAERAAMEIAHSSDMNLTILRFSTLYGEADPGNLNRLISLIDQRRFIWLGHGDNRKSLLYKGDAARACLAVVLRPPSGVAIYNVSAPPCTMREIIDNLTMAVGKEPLPGHIPASLALFGTAVLKKLSSGRLGQLHTTVVKWLADDNYDTRLFAEELHFETETQLAKGLKRQVDWYNRKKATD